MTAPAGIGGVAPLPGSRVLLGWWRELATLPVLRLWYAPLLVHRIEAQVEQSWPVLLSPLECVLLEEGVPAHLNYTSADEAFASSSPLSHRLLASEPGLVQDTVRELLQAKLLAPASAQETQSTGPAIAYRSTAQGQQALRDHQFLLQESVRRVFYFAEAEAGASPCFLPFKPLEQLAVFDLPDSPAPALSDASIEWRFDPTTLVQAVAQAPEWKTQRYFPTEVQSVRLPFGGSPSESSETGQDWQAVILDQMRLVPQLWVQLAVHEEVQEPHLLGFPVAPDGWVLHRNLPILSLGAGWQEVVAPLVGPLTSEDAKSAWSTWCQSARMPIVEVNECQVSIEGHRLLVRAPGKLIERLRVARSELFRGEGWLLAGVGRIKELLRIELMTVVPASGAVPPPAPASMDPPPIPSPPLTPDPTDP